LVSLPSLQSRSGEAIPVRRPLCLSRLHQLAYLSQSDTPFDAFHRRIEKIKQKLGGEDDWSHRPKGMHRRRHEQLLKKLLDTQSQLYQLVSPTMLKRLKRCP
jgi:hypothetical protein